MSYSRVLGYTLSYSRIQCNLSCSRALGYTFKMDLLDEWEDGMRIQKYELTEFYFSIWCSPCWQDRVGWQLPVEPSTPRVSTRSKGWDPSIPSRPTVRLVV